MIIQAFTRMKIGRALFLGVRLAGMGGKIHGPMV